MSNEAWQYTTRGRLSTTIERVKREIPLPEHGEIVVKLKAAALNPVEEQLAQESDFMLRFMGWPHMGTPIVPCSDYSGVVHFVGTGITKWKVGDEVFGVRSLSPEGTLQQYIAVPASSPVARRPPSLSFTDAAALPLVYCTVYTALVNYGKLPFDPAPADVGKRSVLILGGSSGTGSVGIQLAKKMGLRVVTTCSTKNVELVKKLGADEVIDYTTQHVLSEALHSHHAPYAVILDCAGGKDLLPSLDHLILSDPGAPELGIYVTIVGDKTGRDAMGGSITNYFYPSQAIRTARGKLNDYLPSYIPSDLG
ncbi:zinc ion binding [Saitozyma podzolica]|uniref:Zinc ion binding n=1 Tax=Saitozyma podzolica TaxID=1890683 RepID=A0A427YS04_9TREE|nr:zinc ion binding [Saitozyma podzolica]